MRYARERRGDDDGFTMAEVLVAIAVVSVVMLSLSSFFVTSIRIDGEQGDRQSAIQAAGDAMERARSLQVGALLSGRDRDSSTTQWSKPIAAVANLLTTTTQTMAYDRDAAPGAGADAVLPTTFRPLVLNGVVYRQYWYIGLCQRPATGGTCVARSTTTRFTSFYRVIVGVTWPGRSCPGTVCGYVTTSLIADRTDEPVFDTNEAALPVSITSTPGAQTATVGTATGLTLTASGGSAPLTWSATALPAGLAIGSGTGVVGGVPLAAGTSAVTVTVTDAYGQRASVSFTWTVNPAVNPAPVSPASSGTVS